MTDARRSYLERRASVLAQIRAFFAERGVLEVETPLLRQSTVTDPHLSSFSVFQANGQPAGYLQTSPEFAMKGLLAAGSGSIYQICKAFRCEEQGNHHHPEFTMLEWYRLDFDHHQLMAEVDFLLQAILKTETADRYSYADLFQRYLNINPLDSTAAELSRCAIANHLSSFNATENPDRDFWLHLLFSHGIEPHLGQSKPAFVLDFPASMAALAKICPNNPQVAQRFEVYFRGVELANGYHELTDVVEQELRFVADNAKRCQLQLPEIAPDPELLMALQKGLPSCAGVALGVDRLVMLALGVPSIHAP